MTLRAEVELRGFDAQIKRLVAYDRSAEKHMRDAHEQAIRNLVPAWKATAPFETGQYQRSITGRVRRLVGGEVVSIIGTPVTERGFPYPAHLEESPNLHYRTTTRRGQETRGQIRSMFKRRVETLLGIFERAADRILNDLWR